MSVTSTTELEANQMSAGLYYMEAVLPGWSKRVFSSQKRHGWVWNPPSFLFSWYRGYFPRVKWPGRDVHHSPLSGAEVKKVPNLYIYHLSVFMAYTGITLPFIRWHLNYSSCSRYVVFLAAAL